MKLDYGLASSSLSKINVYYVEASARPMEGSVHHVYSNVIIVRLDQLLSLDIGSSNYVTLRVELRLEGCGLLVADTESVVMPKAQTGVPTTSSLPFRRVGKA